jgi:hypothetical protein
MRFNKVEVWEDHWSRGWLVIETKRVLWCFLWRLGFRDGAFNVF